MSHIRQYLRTAEMAKLAHINTRTLHYYDEIGLFSPVYKDAHGYRFYTIEQLNDLGLILSLKELSLSLKDIQLLLHQDASVAKQSLMTQKETIETKMDQLKTIHQLLTRKISDLDIAKHRIGVPLLIDLEEAYLQLSPSVAGMPFTERLAIGYDLLISQPYIFANNIYGTMTHSDKQQLSDYDFFFVQSDHKQQATFIKPAGRYLSVIYQGDDNGLDAFYADLKRMMGKKNWQAEGYFFERTLHETLLANQQHYLTEIQVKIKDAQ